MPLYEYVCKKCGRKFSEVLSIRDHDTKKIECP
ncbi:MAG: FmdB family zinc ribbon protein, partial [Verrucomicrobiota bacterium]